MRPSMADKIVDAMFDDGSLSEVGWELLRMISDLLPVWLRLTIAVGVPLIIAMWVYAVSGNVLAVIYRVIRTAVIAGKHLVDDRLTAAWYRIRGKDPF